MSSKELVSTKAVTDSEPRNKALQALWDLYLQIFSARGVDLNALIDAGVEKTRLSLGLPGARADFDELCKNGCAAPVLALLVGFMRFSPNTATLWSEVIGDRERRMKAIRSFRRAADTIDDILSPLKGAQVPKDVSDASGIASPETVAASLRAYCQLLDLPAEMAKAADVRSSGEAAKFLLVSYVKRVTGRHRDRNVAGIIGEVLGPDDHNEVAQRMWRHRHGERIQGTMSAVTDLLIATGRVISHTT